MKALNIIQNGTKTLLNHVNFGTVLFCEKVLEMWEAIKDDNIIIQAVPI